MAILSDSPACRCRAAVLLRFLRALAAMLPGLLVLATAGAAQGAEFTSLEYAVKATYLYKFAPFITWPGADSAASFTLCVGGSDPVTAFLAQAVNGQSVQGKPIVIRHVETDAALAGCKILYLAPSPSEALLAQAAQGKPVLTVGNDPYAGDHGIISFEIVGGHVRFDIDEQLAKRSGLVISSKLLSLANAVTSGPRP